MSAALPGTQPTRLMLGLAATSPKDAEYYAVFGDLVRSCSTTRADQAPGPIARLLAEIREKHEPGSAKDALNGGPLHAERTLAGALTTMASRDMNSLRHGPKLRYAVLQAAFVWN